jgi:hypothetical protein
MKLLKPITLTTLLPSLTTAYERGKPGTRLTHSANDEAARKSGLCVFMDHWTDCTTPTEFYTARYQSPKWDPQKHGAGGHNKGVLQQAILPCSGVQRNEEEGYCYQTCRRDVPLQKYMEEADVIGDQRVRRWRCEEEPHGEWAATRVLGDPYMQNIYDKRPNNRPRPIAKAD